MTLGRNIQSSAKGACVLVLQAFVTQLEARMRIRAASAARGSWGRVGI